MPAKWGKEKKQTNRIGEQKYLLAQSSC